MWESVRGFYAVAERPTTEKGSAAAEAIDEPTLALGRPPQAAGTDHRRRDAQLARRRRRRQVLVESGRLRSGAAAIGERGDLHDLLPPGHRDVEQIAGTHYPRRLGRLLVEVDLAAVAGPRGERTALEEARGPQPLVEAHLGHDVCTVARSLGYTRGRTGRLPPRGSASWRRPPRMRDSTRARLMAAGRPTRTVEDGCKEAGCRCCSCSRSPRGCRRRGRSWWWRTGPRSPWARRACPRAGARKAGAAPSTTSRWSTTGPPACYACGATATAPPSTRRSRSTAATILSSSGAGRSPSCPRARTPARKTPTTRRPKCT